MWEDRVPKFIQLSPCLFGRVWTSIAVQQERSLGPLALPPLLNSAAQMGHNVTVGVAVHCSEFDLCR
jgi:hypothetical protein